MLVEISINIPSELYNILDYTIETDGKVKLIDVKDRYHIVYDIEASKVIVYLKLGELVIHRCEFRPQPVIVVDLPFEKIELIRKLMV